MVRHFVADDITKMSAMKGLRAGPRIIAVHPGAEGI